MKGISGMVVVGKYGGFHIHTGKFAWRVCLAWVSIAVYLCDMEAMMESLIKDPPLEEVVKRKNVRLCVMEGNAATMFVFSDMDKLRKHLNCLPDKAAPCS